MSRDLDTLEPVTREKARRLIGAAAAVGMEVFVVHAHRSESEQEALWQLGRNDAGEVVAPRLVVTNARSGDSWHQHRRAFDLAFEEVDGKPTWMETREGDWRLLGLMGERVGLEWGGSDTVGTKGDLGHFQFRDGMTIRQARYGRI